MRFPLIHNRPANSDSMRSTDSRTGDSVMRRHIVCLIALTFITAATSWAAAQERAAAAGGGGADAALAPFVDEATIAVARVDVAAIKPEAVQAWVTDQM